MSIVFLDTVGLLARLDKADQWHESATKAFKELIARGDQTVTTTLVLLECGNAAARKPYRSLIGIVRQKMENSGTLIAPTAQDVEVSWAAYSRGTSGDAGIVDYISFTVMRRLGITDVFTNDRHFKAAGFNPLF